MALIKCEHCGRPISDKAPFCPKCGYLRVKAVSEENQKQKVNVYPPENNIPPKSPKGWWAIGIIGLLILAGGIVWLVLGTRTNHEQYLAELEYQRQESLHIEEQQRLEEQQRFDMAQTVTPQSSPDNEKKPSIIKKKPSISGWKDITLKGYSEFSDKKYPIKVKAKVRHDGRWTKYKDGVYQNINHNATFPVDITVENGTLYIKRSGKEEDMTMIMYKDNDSQEWTGTMITKNHIMDCYLKEN